MTQRNDGGPAFGHAGSEWSDGCWVDAPVQNGMTLRDYFAAKALAALIAEPPWEGGSSALVNILGQSVDGFDVSGRYAYAAYAMADAMLAARERT